MPIDKACSAIRETVVAQCNPYQFGEPWDFLPAHDEVRCLPADPARLVTALQETYSQDTLIQAGVAEFDEDGSLRIRVKLNAPGELVVIFRDRQTGVVVDMLTEMGSVFEEDLPIFNASVGEQLLLVPDQEDYEVLVVLSIEDLAVLRACNIPATLAAGLECLRPADVDRLCETFGLDRRKSARLEESELTSDEAEEEESSGVLDPVQRLARFGGRDVGTDHSGSNESTDAEGGVVVAEDDPMGQRLVFVGWSPATLDSRPPAAFDAVTTSLNELQRHMGLDLSEVHAWLATPEDVEHLEFLMRYRDAAPAREALLDSLFDHMRAFEHVGRKQAKQLTVPADFSAAVLMLREAVLADGSDGDGVRRRREALQQVERLLHQQVVGPMMDEAMESPGATERATGLAAAQLVQMFLTQGVVINARIARMISQKGMAGFDALPLEDIKGLLGMGDRVTKLFRELDRCRESTTNVIQLSAMPRPQSLALPRFD